MVYEFTPKVKKMMKKIYDDRTFVAGRFKELPNGARNEFKSWVGEYKQQTWDSIHEGWERAFACYYPEFLEFIKKDVKARRLRR